MSKAQHALLTVSTLMLAGAAHAEDGKIYPAAFCAGALVGNPPIVSFSSEAVTNNSTANSAVLACPVVKDLVFSSAGVNEANMRYCKSDSTGFLADFYSYSAYGSSNFRVSRSDFSAGGCRTFTWGAVGGWSEGFYSFIVVIPPSASGATYKSKLISYRVDEND